MYLDGSIKSVNINQQNFKGKSITERKVGPKQKNLLGGKTNKPEKTFGKKHMPF
jgi:hypothetical protein